MSVVSRSMPRVARCSPKMGILVMELFMPSLSWKTGDEMPCLSIKRLEQMKVEERKELDQCTLSNVEEGSMITQ